MTPTARTSRHMLKRRVLLLQRRLGLPINGQVERATDDVDFAAESVEREIAHDARGRLLDELARCVAAMGRIDAGCYGICECGVKIPERRLLVLPETPYCIACAEAAERAARDGDGE